MSPPAGAAANAAMDGKHVLSTARLDVRWVRDDDADFIVELVNDPDWLRYIGDRGIHTPDEARAWMDAAVRPSRPRRAPLT